MDPRTTPDGDPRAVLGQLSSPTDRRRFLKWSGAAAATAILVGCDQPTEPEATPLSPAAGDATAASSAQVTIDLGDDIGILNFAYALEQLEAAFYTQVVNRLYSGASSAEATMLRDVQNHELVHREFLAAALGSAALPQLGVDFSSVDFGSRTQVLETARALEDTGVGAYNGAAQFLRNGDFLLVAGKIVSVEARHASAIRDVIGRSFAPRAFDFVLTFEQVFRRAAPFITTDIALAHSPTARTAGQTADEEMTS